MPGILGLLGEIGNRPLRMPTRRGWTWGFVALGIAIRIVEYAWDRPTWLDEQSIRDNIRFKTIAEMFGPMGNHQLAPPGFLVVERLLFRVFGDSDYALRLMPLACGIAALFLTVKVARAFLDPGAVPLAVGLVALADELVYYASELKPYSGDAAFGLLAYGIVLGLDGRPVAGRRFASAAIVGAAIVWFSFPAVFVLGGAGAVAIGKALAGGARSRATRLAILGLIWASSFAASYLAAKRQLGADPMMWVFWRFAFPPRSLGEVFWIVRRWFFLFVLPLNFGKPLGPRFGAMVPAVLWLVGAIRLGRERREVLALLLAPAALSIMAAHLRLYPFHGRLLLFLVPGLLMTIAEGADWVRDATRSRVVWIALLAALFAWPVVEATTRVLNDHELRSFHPHGDLRPPTFDPENWPF